jgi:hypothetical protein
MLRGAGQQRLTSLEFLLVLLGLQAPGESDPATSSSPAESIDEPALVALSVLHRCLPAWPASEKDFAAAAQNLIESDGLSSEQRRQLTDHLPNLAAHSSRFLALLHNQAKFQ